MLNLVCTVPILASGFLVPLCSEGNSNSKHYNFANEKLERDELPKNYC